ncbi:hypothetical protein [Bordetella hinzii]|uniref:hypothetical protein n=1 Tax=Bordetella hinzii TaxID=103855 RepID=UPI000764B0F5|nr:hypothetical protein [Bordetella hinzii]KXA71054.1 hypothetical protein AXA74_20340 [Bordetella hinzii LMG 13501]VEH23163.1 Uncharacterised protein [Bordetella hinzii]
MKTYRAIKPFPHGNSYVAAGAPVRLTDKQATFLRSGGYIEESDPVPDAPTLADPPEAPAAEAAPAEPAAKKGGKQ